MDCKGTLVQETGGRPAYRRRGVKLGRRLLTRSYESVQGEDERQYRLAAARKEVWRGREQNGVLGGPCRES